MGGRSQREGRLAQNQLLLSEASHHNGDAAVDNGSGTRGKLQCPYCFISYSVLTASVWDDVVHVLGGRLDIALLFESNMLHGRCITRNWKTGDTASSEEMCLATCD